VKAVNRELRFSTTNSASSYGSGEFRFACYTITEATEEEIQQLHQFGYM